MSIELLDLTPQWVKSSQANPEWRAAQADYMSDHDGLSAFEKLAVRLAAVERMNKIDTFYYEQEMKVAA